MNLFPFFIWIWRSSQRKMSKNYFKAAPGVKCNLRIDFWNCPWCMLNDGTFKVFSNRDLYWGCNSWMGFPRLQRVCFSLKRVRGVTSSELYPAHVCWVFPEFSFEEFSESCWLVSRRFIVLSFHSFSNPTPNEGSKDDDIWTIWRTRPDRVKLIF